MTQNLRLLAARIIDDVANGRSLADCLEPVLGTITDPRDRAFVQAVCYGVCRFYSRLDVVLSHLLEKPMKAKDSDVHALLLVGLYQLMEMRIPEYAAVTETVNAAGKIKKSWARGLANAVLRGYLRRKTELETIIADDEEAYYAHPDWWISSMQTAWPEQWQAILAANNMHPPFALRVNQQKITRDDYIKKVADARSIPETGSGIILATALGVQSLPGFAQGEISVQDGAAQLAPELLQLAPGQYVLDACSAPGGKLAHMLEKQPDLTVVAVERDAERVKLIHENLRRLGLEAEVICADAAETDDWWNGKLFDRILLDAPCSASGVVRRHPDIKLLREAEDIPALAEEQLTLLAALWPLLKPNGLLIYATCSVFPEENVQVIEHFLSEHDDAREEPIKADWGMACQHGRQILPGMHDMDGFYYAVLRKA